MMMHDDVLPTLFIFAKSRVPTKSLSPSPCHSEYTVLSLLPLFFNISRVFSTFPTKPGLSKALGLNPLKPRKTHLLAKQISLRFSHFCSKLATFSVKPLSPSSSPSSLLLKVAQLFMAKTKPGRKDLDSYTIKGTNKVVRRIFSFSHSLLEFFFLIYKFMVFPFKFYFYKLVVFGFENPIEPRFSFLVFHVIVPKIWIFLFKQFLGLKI